MHYSLISCIFLRILRLCSCCELCKRKQGFLSTQCTIQGQSGSPESHLISSSLHVINLPAQCYCSAGHSSSFRERGIDQAGTASVVHLCVLWANREKWTKLCGVYNTSTLHSSAFLHPLEERCRSCLEVKQQVLKQQSQLVCTLTSCGLIQLAVFSTYHQYKLIQTSLLCGSHQENWHQGQVKHCSQRTG